MSASVILDPPDWVWRIIHASSGDPTRLRSELEALDPEGLALFSAYVRDMATRLTSAAYPDDFPAGLSDERVFECACEMVMQGREHYRDMLRDPSPMRRAWSYDQDARCAPLALVGEIHARLFGEEVTTDLVVHWRADGSAEPQ